MSAFDDPEYSALLSARVRENREKVAGLRLWNPDDDLPLENGQDRNQPRRFQLTQFSEIHDMPGPAYTVDKLIPRRGVVVVWGKPKCGKTFWTFDLEMHVALGRTYRGMKVEHGEVLHIACEGVAGLAMRKEAWRLHHIRADPATVDAIDAARFHLCKDTALDLIKDVDTLISDIVAQIGDRPIRIITIDTLNRSLRGSENSDEDMADYVRAATLLAEQFQCAVILIHHCGHNEARPRGHSSLLGAVDALIEIKKDDLGSVRSEVEELRDGPTGQTTVSRLEVVDVIHDENGTMITSCVIVENNAEQGARKNGAPCKKPKPSPLGEKFYNALNDALCTSAAKPRNQSAGRPSVTEDEWHRELVRLGLVDDNKSNRTRAKISKYRSELIAANRIAFNGGIVWAL